MCVNQATLYKIVYDEHRKSAIYGDYLLVGNKTWALLQFIFIYFLNTRPI